MMHRRSFLTALGAGCAFAQSQLFWTVETTSGKVQGIANTGIEEFKGIPYGAPTSGKNRYLPPQKPASWTGVRECFGHGQICPQTLANLNSDYGSSWVSLARTGNPNWPAYDSDKRATMVFNNETRVENAPRSEIRKFWQEMPSPRRS